MENRLEKIHVGRKWSVKRQPAITPCVSPSIKRRQKKKEKEKEDSWDVYHLPENTLEGGIISKAQGYATKNTRDITVKYLFTGSVNVPHSTGLQN